MESKKTPEARKENIRQMFQEQQERSRERLVKAGQKSDEAQMFGFIGQRGTAIILILFGGFYILGASLYLSSPAKFPQYPMIAAIFILILGLALVTIGILNFVTRHLKMVLINGILLIVSGLLTLTGNFIVAAFPLIAGIYFVRQYLNTVKFLRRREAREAGDS